MIISASYKTDIPAFYGEWFMNRLRAGFCRVRSPYGGKAFMVDLRPEAVDGFVFWTRNLGPFMAHLETLRATWPFVVQFGVTGYPRALDAATVAPESALAQIRQASHRFGPRAVVWRYDPILFSTLTPPQWHRETFARLAGDLAGAVDEVVVSFAQIYRKSARNLGAAGIAWEDPADEEKRVLLSELAALAVGHGMRLTLCAQPHLLAPGVEPAACIDAGRLSDLAGREITVPRKPHRPECGCWASRDLGDYDSCPQGCAYCYAVKDRETAKRHLAAHDPNGEFLLIPRD